MEANADVIAALEQLEAAMAKPESKEWLTSRKEIGRQIDPEAVDVYLAIQAYPRSIQALRSPS